MEQNMWKQVNIAYPGTDVRHRERQAVDHLSRVLPGVEADGILASWWYIRKGPWRVRYLLANSDVSKDPVRPLLTDGFTWTSDVYEPEIHAFGGAASMNAAHTLFHHDSRHLLDFLSNNASARRERSLILCTALMRSAGLDLNEQGDVWAQVAERRKALPNQPAPDPTAWAAFTNDTRYLLLGTARPDSVSSDWITAFERTGTALRALRDDGQLTRGIRAVIALHVIFHWNRLGLPAAEQAMVANAANNAIFDTP